MKKRMEGLFRQYGTGLTLEHGGQELQIRGFLQPVQSKGIGELSRPVERFLFYGPPGIPAAQGDVITQGDRRFLLRRAEPCFLGDQEVYCWGLAVPEASGEAPGRILVNGMTAATVRRWKVKIHREAEPVYGYAESGPKGIAQGRVQYDLELEGITPAQGQEELALLESFRFRVPQGERFMVYEGCTWQKFSQQETERGMTILAEARAVSRRESEG